MYGVTKGLDLSALIGLTVEQVALGQYQFQINLDQDGFLYIESSAKFYAFDNLVEEWATGDVANSTSLVALLGKKIVSASVHPPDRIDVTFEDGYAIQIFESPDQFESLQINPGGIII